MHSGDYNVFPIVCQEFTHESSGIECGHQRNDVHGEEELTEKAARSGGFFCWLLFRDFRREFLQAWKG